MAITRGERKFSIASIHQYTFPAQNIDPGSMHGHLLLIPAESLLLLKTVPWFSLENSLSPAGSFETTVAHSKLIAVNFQSGHRKRLSTDKTEF